MSTFSINKRLDDLSDEVAEVSGATAFLLRGTNGMVGASVQEYTKLAVSASCTFTRLNWILKTIRHKFPQQEQIDMQFRYMHYNKPCSLQLWYQ
jgi:hypothetical protein